MSLVTEHDIEELFKNNSSRKQQVEYISKMTRACSGIRLNKSKGKKFMESRYPTME